MSKGTSRRAFSVKGITYQRVSDYVAEIKGKEPKASVSGFVEDAILVALGAPTPEELQKFDEENQKRISEKRVKPDVPASLEGYVPPILLL